MMYLVLVCLLLLKSVNLSEPSFYDVLGVSRDTSQQEIRQAYKKLAVKLHPDKNPNEEEKFLKITEAYETLKDPEKRRRYDQYGQYPSYTRQYDSKSQAEYNTLFYNGLYHDDEYVDTLSGKSFQSYFNDGLHFINFYSPFCPPCQTLCDHWKRLAKVYKGIVKVGAVNCKYHNSFCYNNMRINSYPTLSFYPNGKSGGYIYYTGDRTFRSLERLVLQYLRKRTAHTHTQRRARGTVLYLLAGWGEEETLRIAYRMKHVAAVLSVDSESLRSSLLEGAGAGQGAGAGAVLQLGGREFPIFSYEEEELIEECLRLLPAVEQVDPQVFQKIRTRMRSGGARPYVLHFSSGAGRGEGRGGGRGEGRGGGRGGAELLLHTLVHEYPDLDFGTIDCDKWSQLCASLQATPPSWGVLKLGGAYQSGAVGGDVTAFLRAAPWAHNLHSLSLSEARRILDGEQGVWLLAIIPHGADRDTVDEAFTQTCQYYENDLQCGYVSCSLSDTTFCRELSGDHPALILQNSTRRDAYVGRYIYTGVQQFVHLLRYNPVVKLTAATLSEVLNHETRSKSWAVAYLPTLCGLLCDQLAQHWRIVGLKLQPLSSLIGVGTVECSRQQLSVCGDLRAPTVRVYPLRATHSYVSNLQQLSEWSLMCEWALQYLLPAPPAPAPAPPAPAAPAPAPAAPARLSAPLFTQTVLSSSSEGRPWLVYFHSPRCHHCYEMYPDFFITATLLRSAVSAGQVNCISERALCREEQIMAYPSLKLYLSPTKTRAFSNVISIPVTDYETIMQTIRPHLQEYDEELIGVDTWGVERQTYHVKHDEF